MHHRVFDLKYVSKDEANALRRHLLEKGIHYYETPSGSYSAPAIWVKSDSEAARALEAITKFNSQWLQKAKAQREEEFARPKKAGPRLWLVAAIFLMILALYSLRPFL